MIRNGIALALGLALFCPPFLAEAAAQQAAQQVENEYLADRFTSLAGGIALRPPKGAAKIRPSAVGSNIAQFVNASEQWSLTVSRLYLENGAKLSGVDDPRTPLVDESLTKPGLVEETARSLQQQSGGRVLHHDLMNVGRHDAGLVVVRYSQAQQSWLRQQAIVRSGFYPDTVFYVLDLTTPSTAALNDQEEDPTEATAVAVFRAVLDSVELIDQKPIELDNRERRIRTRSFLVGLSNRVRLAVKSEQYFRVQQNGKDIGWSFVAEDVGERLGKSGVFVAALTDLQTDAVNRVQRGVEMFCADDRSTEAWGALTVSEQDGKRSSSSEFAQADQRVTRTLDADAVDPADPRQPRMNVERVPVLNVTQILPNQLGATPIARQLPVEYLPQVVAHLLPRVTPLDRAQGYLFAVWSSGDREIVYRYIDVEQPKPGTFAGQHGNFVVIRDRLGLEGEPTLHYLTPAGQYLGSHTPSTNVTVILSDQRTIAQLYPSAKVVRPKLLDSAPSAAPASSATPTSAEAGARPRGAAAR